MISIFPKLMNVNYISLICGRYDFSTKKKVLLFGGQGTHQKGMFQKYLSRPQKLKTIQCQSQLTHINLLQIGCSDPNNLLNQTQYTQPILILSHYLQFEQLNVLKQTQPQNIYCVGHSLGEYSALMIAGAINLTDCLSLVKKRGQLMMQCAKGRQYGMLILKFKKDKQIQITNIVKDMDLQVSCYNSPTNILISGTIDKITELATKLRTQLKVGSMKLPVSTAFHCQLLKPMQIQFQKQLNSIDFKVPKYKIIRNADSKIYRTVDQIKEGLLQQNTKPVQFLQTIQKLINKHGKQNLEFIQVGDKEHLTKWVHQIIKGN